MESTQETDLPVKHWSEEQLEEWAVNNITAGTLPKPDWHQRQVAIWARRVLNFEEISAKYLCELGVDGQALLAFKKIEDLFEDFEKEMQTERTLKISLRKLWVQIETLRSIEEAEREMPEQGKKRKHSKTVAADSDEETPKAKKQKLDPHRNYAPRAKPVRFLYALILIDSVQAVNQAVTWVGRSADLTRMQEVFARNQDTLAFRPTTIAIGGPCGIGKTRLALQFIENSGFDVTLWEVIPPHCKDVNELLNSQLGFNSVHFNDNFKAFINKKLEKKDENACLKCVIYLDSIQHLDFNELLKLRYAICSTCAERNGRVVIQLIISGVQTAFLRASFTDDEWLSLKSTGGIVLINLQPLSTTESSQLLEDILTVHKTSNAKQIISLPFVIESLKWMGGNPRLIEFLADKLAKTDLANCTAERLLKAVEKLYWTLHSDRLGRPDSYYKLITSACLARVQLKLGDTLSDGTGAITVKQLIYEGLAVWSQIDDKAFGTKEAKGYLSLPLAVIRWYVTRHNIRNTFSLKLFTPDLNWQWKDFEHFTAELVALRLRAYWVCGYKSISLKSFFKNIPMSLETQEHEIPLGPFIVRRLESHCESASDVTSVLIRQFVSPIEKDIENADDDENKKIAETLLQKTKAEMDFLIVRNAPLAPSWDAAVYVKNKLVLAIQTKHTERINDPSEVTVTKKTITDEQRKVPATVPLLFITNRPVQDDAQNLAVTRSRLIIVHRDNLNTMLGAFSNLW